MACHRARHHPTDAGGVDDPGGGRDVDTAKDGADAVITDETVQTTVTIWIRGGVNGRTELETATITTADTQRGYGYISHVCLVTGTWRHGAR